MACVLTLAVPAFAQGPPDTWRTMSTTGTPPRAFGRSVVWTGSQMIVWGGFLVDTPGYTNGGGIYDLAADTWGATSTSDSPSPRRGNSAVWTGDRMIVWGGVSNTENGTNYRNDGKMYNPLTNSWEAMAAVPNFGGRVEHFAVWTGSKMIVWGGNGDSRDGSREYNDGAIYDRASNSWTLMSTIGAPSKGGAVDVVWTGNKMVVWGGQGFGAEQFEGAMYDPTTDTWTAINATGAPAPRRGHRMVWTGTRVLVWGGTGFKDGGSFDPVTNTWQTMTGVGAPPARAIPSAVWTGKEMIVWGGEVFVTGLTLFRDGGRYDPAADAWSPVATTGAPSARELHAAIWTGSEMIVWGGRGAGNLTPGGFPPMLSDGGIYSPPRPCSSFSITPGPAAAPSAAGVTAVTISAVPVGCTSPWTAEGNGAWLRASPKSGNGSGSVNVSWFENPTTSSRSGSVAIAGRTFTVNQAAAAANVPALSIGDVSIQEGNSSAMTATFSVTLTPPSATTVTVDYATEDRAAKAPGDYSSASGTLTFGPGENTKSIGVQILGDQIAEGNEKFGVLLSNPTGAPIADGEGAATIMNDESSSDQVYTPVTPCRFVNGVASDLVSMPSNARATRFYNVRGACGVPPEATAIMTNLTVASPTADGDLTVDAGHLSGPSMTSTMNYTFGTSTGKNLAHGTIAGLCDGSQSDCLNGDIRVTFHAGDKLSKTYFLADVLGYFAPLPALATPAQLYTPVRPCRFVNGVFAGDRVSTLNQQMTKRYYRVRGSLGSDFSSQGAATAPTGCGIPSDATAVMVNVAVADPDWNGDLRVDPAHLSTPSSTSVLNYTFGSARGKNLANGVIVPLCDSTLGSCASGANPTIAGRDLMVTFAAGGGNVSTYFLADVLGYFAPTASQTYTPVTSCRFVDGIFAGDRVTTPANATTIRSYRVRGTVPSDFSSQGAATAPSGCGIPEKATAVMVNMTVADPDGDGDLRVDPAHLTEPSATSVLNYTFGGDRSKNLANAVIVPLCDKALSLCASGATPRDGGRDLFVTFHAGDKPSTTYFLADVVGYFAPKP
jgi:hypothetical protein